MKIATFIAALFLFFTCILSAPGCTKKKGAEEGDCETCKAFATSTKPEVTQQVCSDQAEDDFRSQHTGQEISCF